MATFGKRISKPKPPQTKGLPPVKPPDLTGKIDRIVKDTRKAREKDQHVLDDLIIRDHMGVERKRRRSKGLFG